MTNNKYSMLRKVVSVLCIVALLCGTVSFAISAEEGQNYAIIDKTEGKDPRFDNTVNIPTVYVLGNGDAIVVDRENGTTERIYPITLPENFVNDVVNDNIDMFKHAFFTQDWSEFCDVLYETIVPLFEELKLDENGKATNGSRSFFEWNINSMYNHSGSYDLRDYLFSHDFRVDPFETADILDRYIDDVLTATGASKVCLVGRCQGACITSAYLAKYGSSKIEKVIYFNGAHGGAEVCSKAYSGQLYFNGDGLERFAYDYDFTDLLGMSSDIQELVRSLLTVLKYTYGLDFASWAVTNVYNKIAEDITPRILNETFATWPGLWAMVSDEDYELAKQIMFSGDTEGKYDNFIKTIDNYHYNVQCKLNDLVRECQNNGVPCYNIVKYGMQSLPFSRNDEDLSDGLCLVRLSSFGANCTDIDSKFSNKYTAAAVKAGTAKYISMDMQIDASTSVMPDTSFFIKNLGHFRFPKCSEHLVSVIVNTPDFDVDSNDNYPQYLVYDVDENLIVPMTPENEDTTQRWSVKFFDALKTLFEKLKILIGQLLNKENPEPVTDATT